jgi:hypothetical protein
MGPRLLISTVISDVPSWVSEAQAGIKQYRLKRKLDKAFAFLDDEDPGMDVGTISGEFALELKARIEQGKVDKVMLEMEHARESSVSNRPLSFSVLYWFAFAP